MTVSWNADYPDKRRLKHEVRCMVDAFAEALLAAVPHPAVEGIYWKGSAQKDWDSPLDYVPEISDVDIHILFADEASVEKHLGTPEQALCVQADVEARYAAKVPQPIHLPRPQLIVLNHLMQWEDYVPSPRSAVTVLYGRDAPVPDYSDPERLRRINAEQLVADGEYLSKFPLRAIDKPAKFLWEILRHLVWHVSPVGPKVLHLLGVETAQAWSMNRTAIVGLLGEMGEGPLAGDYARFYLSGWRYFLSHYSDTDAGRSSLEAGVRTLARGVEIAKAWLAGH